VTITFEVPDFSQAAAWIGALTGIAALLWQVVNWRRLSHNVRVVSANSWPIYGDELGDAMVAVTARNSGTSAVTITSWGIDVGGENAVMFRPINFSTPLPHRLEPGAEATFHMPSDNLYERQAASKVPFAKMRPWVRLATGKTVFSRKGLPLTA